MDSGNGGEAHARLAAGLAAYALGVPSEEIFTPGRGVDRVAAARQLAMYLMHTAFSASFQRVAIAFARDRSTVAHAVRQVEDRREDPNFDDLVAGLEAMLEVAPGPAPVVSAGATA